MIFSRSQTSPDRLIADYRQRSRIKQDLGYPEREFFRDAHGLPKGMICLAFRLPEIFMARLSYVY
jgi:hypothetical protein